jgi:hypothetical protein
VVLLDGVKHIVDNLVQGTVSRSEELGHDWSLSLWVRDDTDNVEWLVTVDSVGRLLELRE